VNRVSVGVQSMPPHGWPPLGRTDRRTSSEPSAIEAGRDADVQPRRHLRSGRGIVDDWRRTVEEVLAFDPPHAGVRLDRRGGNGVGRQP
jgi:hypothetical protein